jgi:outer membrane protein TolC
VKALEGKASIADSRNSLGSLEDSIADMQNTLNDLVGLPLNTATQLVEPDEQIEVAPTEEAPTVNIESQALAHNADLLSAQLQIAKAHADLKAARAEYIPDISVFAQDVSQNGAPLLPTNSGAVGVRMDWTISEFGKRIGLVRARQSEVAQAQENLHITENKVRMDTASEIRKILRTETSLEAARESVASHAELVRIIGNQVEAKTEYKSALKDAEAQLADTKAQLFDVQMQRATAQAELMRTLGRQ